MALVKLNVNTNNTLNLSFYSACGCNEHHTRRFPQVEYDCFELREPPSRYLLKTLCGGAKPVECFVAGRVCSPDFILNIISLPAKLTFNNVFSLPTPLVRLKPSLLLLNFLIDFQLYVIVIR